MITAHALAHTSPIEKLLVKLGDIPKKPVQAYALVTFISGLASLFCLVIWINCRWNIGKVYCNRL